MFALAAIKLLLALAAIGMVAWRVWRSIERPIVQRTSSTTGLSYQVPEGFVFHWRRVVAPAMLALVFIIAVLPSAGIVPSGHVGVVLRWGAVSGNILQPGLFAVVPLAETVELMDVQIQATPEKAAAASKDLQDVTTTITPNWHVNPAKADTVYNTLRRDYVERLIQPAEVEVLKAVTAKFNAEELITRREEVSLAIKSALAARVNPYGIEIDEMNITDFDFSDAFNNAIEAKVTAVQQALQAQNEIKKVEYLAYQRVVNARADSVVTVANAEAAARSIRARANAEAEAIRVQADAIRAQGGAEYVRLQAINRWGGTLPTTMVGYEDGKVPMILNLTK